MTFSLAQLRGFVAVAEHGHFGRAAESLHLTQPPLSRQIQGLERAIGVSLFERGPRGVRITVAGQVFLRDARRALALLEAAPETAQRVATGRAGKVQVAFTTAAALGVLGTLLTEISVELAQLEVTLTEMTSAEQIQAVSDGRVDLGLVRPPVPRDLLDSELVHTEPLVVALPRGHHLAETTATIDPADLLEETLIEYAELGTSYMHDLYVGLLGGGTLVTGQHVSQISTALALVRARRGLAILPWSATTLAVDGVVFRGLVGAAPAVELHACWHRDTLNPALINVVRYLRARIAS